MTDEVVDEIYEWIKYDVSKEQIKSVIWGMMMGNSEDAVVVKVRQMRRDYRLEREEEDNEHRGQD